MNVKTISACGYTARINLSRGANCISLRHTDSGAVILREPPESGELDNPYLYGMPVLFPVNRISSGEFEYSGRRYVFPINEPETGCHLHGMLHQTPFKLVEHTPASLTARYHAKSGEYLGFMHEMRITISYSLSEDGMTHTTRVENLSNDSMPCLIGFHTTFNSRPIISDAPSRVLVDIHTEYERNMKNYLPTGRCSLPDEVTSSLNTGSFDPLSVPISRHYKAAGLGRLQITQGDYKVVYENSANMPFRLIYNGNADEYICLEPQTSLANSPNSPLSRDEAGFHTLPAHSDEFFVSKISITKEI